MCSQQEPASQHSSSGRGPSSRLEPRQCAWQHGCWRQHRMWLESTMV